MSNIFIPKLKHYLGNGGLQVILTTEDEGKIKEFLVSRLEYINLSKYKGGLPQDIIINPFSDKENTPCRFKYNGSNFEIGINYLNFISHETIKKVDKLIYHEVSHLLRLLSIPIDELLNDPHFNIIKSFCKSYESGF